MLFIAHRGASCEAPENTLAAFRAAIAEGADGLEADLRLTRDGRVVVIHDAFLRRTAGRPGAVARMTLARLAGFDVGAWRGTRFAGERVPTLAELASLLPRGRELFLDIKAGTEILRPLRRVLAAARIAPRRVAIMAFDRNVLRAARSMFPDHRVFWLLDLRTIERAAPADRDDAARRLIAHALLLEVDGLNVGTGPALTASFAKHVREAGLGLGVWTVDDPREAARLKALGVQALTTNRPGWLRARLARAEN